MQAPITICQHSSQDFAGGSNTGAGVPVQQATCIEALPLACIKVFGPLQGLVSV